MGAGVARKDTADEIADLTRQIAALRAQANLEQAVQQARDNMGSRKSKGTGLSNAPLTHFETTFEIQRELAPAKALLETDDVSPTTMVKIKELIDKVFKLLDIELAVAQVAQQKSWDVAHIYRKRAAAHAFNPDDKWAHYNFSDVSNKILEGILKVGDSKPAAGPKKQDGTTGYPPPRTSRPGGGRGDRDRDSYYDSKRQRTEGTGTGYGGQSFAGSRR